MRQKTHHNLRTHAASLWCVFLCLSACSNGKPTTPDYPPQTFTIDEPGLLYFYEDLKRGRLAARTLADVPDLRLTAVQVHKPGWPKVEDRSRGAYMLDLSEAKAGQHMTVKWQSRRHVMGAALAQGLGDERAFNVSVLAAQLATSSPNSNRRKRIQHVQDAINKMIPKEKDTPKENPNSFKIILPTKDDFMLKDGKNGKDAKKKSKRPPKKTQKKPSPKTKKP